MNYFISVNALIGENMVPKLRIAIIDLECTCDDTIPFGIEDYEIIEIGVALCDLSIDDLKIIDSMQLYVKPLVRPMLTTFCTELTGIEQTTVDQSAILADALPILDKWITENNVEAWASWGNDRSQFIIECRLKSLINPIKKLQHFDVKRIFSQLFGWRVGMTRAMQIRGVVSEGQLHSGIDDAKNVARILKQERAMREAVLQSVKSVKEKLDAIALDLEGTLISNATSQIARTGLHEFLESCHRLCNRVVIFTTVKESLFRQIATLLVDEGSAPSWFKTIEYINWHGDTKDLSFIKYADINKIVIVDDFHGYIKEGQESRWIEVQHFDHPYDKDDQELYRALQKLKLYL